MKTPLIRIVAAAIFTIALLLGAGCESNGYSGSSSVSVG